MVSFERGDGTLVLAACAIEDPGHEIADARHPERMQLPADTEFVISEPGVRQRLGDPGWTKPAPRRASGTFYKIKNGKKVS